MKEENVLCLPRKDLVEAFGLEKEFWKINPEQLLPLSYSFTPRGKAEEDYDNKQLIPYALIFDKNDRLFTYQRHGSEKRLKDFLSAGIGGHVNENDAEDSLYHTIVKGLLRELKEEIGISADITQLSLLGMINEERSLVGNCHIGIVFSMVISGISIRANEEIGYSQWMDLRDFKIEDNKFELWSELALKLYKLE